MKDITPTSEHPAVIFAVVDLRNTGQFLTKSAHICGSNTDMHYEMVDFIYDKGAELYFSAWKGVAKTFQCVKADFKNKKKKHLVL